MQKHAKHVGVNGLKYLNTWTKSFLVFNFTLYFCNLSDVTSCSPREFSCTNGRCIFKHLHCDGNDNCLDNSDEQNCRKLTSFIVFKCCPGKRLTLQPSFCQDSNSGCPK